MTETVTPYAVKLTVFEGPLDLLLQLIERRELDITTVSLAAVTDQYLDYIGAMTNVEPGILTDFLAVAARLILIKSQALLPRPPALDEGEEQDLGQDLVCQLQEYKRFKEIALLLKERDEKGLHSYIRLATTGITPHIEIEGVVLDDLVEAMRRVLTTLPEEASAPDVQRPQFTIAEKIAVIEQALSGGRTSFQRLLSGVQTRIEAIVTFLALLELIKQGYVRVEQQGMFAEITIVAGNGNRNERVATATSG